MRILIVKLSAFGDIIHALPVLPYLKKIVPRSEVFWAVDAEFAELLEGNPYLDDVVPLPIRHWKKNLTVGVAGEAFRLVGALRSFRFDVCFDIQGNTKSGVVSLLSGASQRWGFDREGVRELPNVLFTNRKTASDPSDIHISKKILRVVGSCFGENFSAGDLKPEVFFSHALKAAVRERLGISEENINMAIHGGTNWETKKLSPAQWVSIITALEKRYRDRNPVIFFTWGSQAEKEESALIIEGMVSAGTPKGSLRLCPFMEIKDLAAFYSMMDVVIGADTGPVHLAAAAGGKTVSYYTAPRGERSAPFGPQHRFIQADFPCTGCFKMTCPISDQCKETITPEKFVHALGELLPG